MPSSYSDSRRRSSKISYEATSKEEVASSRDVKGGASFYSISGKVPARLVLYFLSWSGFLVSFMMRNDMNFAIVAMVRPYEEATAHTLIDTNIAMNSSFSNVGGNETRLTDFMTAQSLTSLQENSSSTESSRESYQYAWSSAVKSVIISSFYWCYVLSQVVGGIATQRFGTKQVFGWSQLATALCSLCIPVFADIHYSAVIILRSIQGFASGLTWPAMYAIVGFWIPLSERSRFMSSFQGFSIGIGLTYPLCGFLIDNFGWRYIFYTTGTLGVMWCIFWYFLAFNTPEEHPRIAHDELEYIKQNISANINESIEMKVPWKSIFTSMPAWSIAITTFGRIWIHYIFIVSGPTFMMCILRFDYKANGLLSGMPFICSYVSSVLFCYIADEFVLRKWIGLTNVRKIFTALSQIVPGILICWIGYIDQSITLLLVIWFAAVIFITASYAGAMANIVDIAPNLAGPVLAFCQTIHMSASFLSPLAAGVIVSNPNSVEQWRTVFGVGGAISIITYLVYQKYGSAKIQTWNNISPTNYDSVEEIKILKSTSDNTTTKQ